MRILILCLLLLALPARAERVVTLAPHLAELVCAVGACDQLVAVGKLSDYPEQVRKLPQISDAHAVNAEAVLAVRPTLVLAWDGGTPLPMIAQLRRIGLRVEAVRVESLDDVGLALLRVGALLGTEDAACQMQADFDRRLLALRERYAARNPIRVLYQIEDDPMFTINRVSPISAAIELCGGRNLFGDLPQLAGAVGREAVIAANPDAIVFGRDDGAEEIRNNWLRFPGLRAVHAGNLLGVDAHRLERSSPRMLEGIEELCAALDGARSRLAAVPTPP